MLKTIASFHVACCGTRYFDGWERDCRIRDCSGGDVAKYLAELAMCRAWSSGPRWRTWAGKLAVPLHPDSSVTLEACCILIRDKTAKSNSNEAVKAKGQTVNPPELRSANSALCNTLKILRQAAMNNKAYGIQCFKCIQETSRFGGKYDVFVQSTHKNLMVPAPVGGAIVNGFDKECIIRQHDKLRGGASEGGDGGGEVREEGHEEQGEQVFPGAPGLHCTALHCTDFCLYGQ